MWRFSMLFQWVGGPGRSNAARNSLHDAGVRWREPVTKTGFRDGKAEPGDSLLPGGAGVTKDLRPGRLRGEWRQSAPGGLR